MATELPKAYDPKDAQQKWLTFWEQTRLLPRRPRPAKKPFTIVIPPPNVTGALHMGHALNNTLQDVLIRWRRMQGYNALWMPGTDHAGIATQAVVERLIFAAGEEDPPRPRPRGTREAHLGVEGQVRGPHPRPASRRLGCSLRLAAHALHARRPMCAGRARDVLPHVPRRLHLPRQTARELGHAPANLRGRRRDLHRRHQGRLLDVQVPGATGAARATFISLQHDAPRNDARRHRRLRASDRRALQAPHRQEGDCSRSPAARSRSSPTACSPTRNSAPAA